MYSAALLNSFNCFNSFYMESLGLQYRISCHLHIMIILPLSFQFGYLFFLFLMWLLWLVLLVSHWIECTAVTQYCKPPLCQQEKKKPTMRNCWEWASLHSSKAFSFSPLSIMLDVDFVINSFYYADICFLDTHLGERFFFFIINRCWIHSNAFSESTDMIM